MVRFLETHALALTPLTPIHIGCGEDFEPTNYVIEDGVLFHFDPATAPLGPEDRKKLSDAVGQGGIESLRRVQKFFFERREIYAACSRGTVSIASGIAAQYAARVGRIAQREETGPGALNALEIERTAHHPHTGTPYIPGSSLKGAIRTAWLDRLNGGNMREGENLRAMELEKVLLGGAFHTDPFRQLKVADAAGAGVVSRVVFCNNQKKRQVLDKQGKEFVGRGPPVRREALVGGQYRVLTAEMRFDLLTGQSDPSLVPKLSRCIKDFREVAASCNRFYRAVLNQELAVLESRRFAAPEWLTSFRELVLRVGPALDEGRAMLLRVGRHSGAESVTLEGVRRIRIMKGKGEPAGSSREGATTLWLAADSELARSEMQPFGWLLVELADAPEIAALKEWCNTQPKPDLDAIRARLQAARDAAAAARARQHQIEAEKRERVAAEERAAMEKAAHLANLSEHGRMIEALNERLERHSGRKQPNSGALYGEVQKLVKLALAADWSATDKRELAALIDGLGFNKIDFAGKTKEIKRAISQLRGA
jgi:CRISPR-associated protein Csm5